MLTPRTPLGTLASAVLLLSLSVAAPPASATDVLGPDDFETGFGSWSNVGGDDFDWTRQSGGTPSSGTGPSGDHTTGSGFYVYTEASSPQTTGDLARLQSPCIDLTSATSADWEFFTHLNGAAMGTLRAQAATSSGPSCASLGSFSSLFTISGNQGDVWTHRVVSLPVGGSVVLRFEGERGTNFTSDMALDDVVVTVPCSSDLQCDDGVACTDDVCNLGSGDCENTDDCPGGAVCSPSAGVCQMPAAQPLVDALDLDDYKSHIQALSSLAPPINGTRYWSTAGNAAARNYIQAELESYGYTVQRHSYTFQSTAMDQVYATKIGADPSRMYIVGGHMDSTNLDSGNPQVYAPGANDDASGTSLVLEAARVFGDSDVSTEVSIRFILWNNEETGLDGSEAYVNSRRTLQGIESPPGSGIYPEPTWLGVIQHDMMMWDHGPGPLPQNPPWPPQAANADVDIEYQASSSASAASLALANFFLAANGSYATDYPAQIGNNMCCTDSVPFEDDVASISLRENRRASEIGNDSDPHWHTDTDVYGTFGPEDFLLGFNALQTTVGALAELAGATIGGVCGDTVLDPGEECDDGNAASGDCCSATCELESAATVCRAAADLCDVPETCTGVDPACPADAFEPAATECRAPADVCDVAELCTGAGAACPANGFEPATTECRAAADVCDVAESCTGTGAACPADNFELATTVCRGPLDVCDVAEVCTGTSAVCPANSFEPATTVCRVSADVCDVAEACTGGGAACPADAFEPATTECRAAADVCDLAEACTGAGAACPADTFEPATTECRAAADVCDLAEACTGAGAACPADAFEPATTECRAAADVCDLAEACTGAGAACPADAFEPATTECRAAADVCDLAEACTGAGAACPADAFEPATTECRAAAGVCDLAEACTGGGAACPADAFEPATTECRAAAGVCDVTELCTGSGAGCPVDDVLHGIPCLDGDVCNGDETCQAGVCAPSEALDCDDGFACTADSCDAVLGCGHALIPGCHVGPVLPASSHWGLALLVLLVVMTGAFVADRKGWTRPSEGARGEPRA